MILNKVISILVLINIHITRTVDHAYRYYSGLPFLSHSEITPQLYLGGQYYKQALHKINTIGITAIVSMRHRPIAKIHGFEHLKSLHLSTPDLHAPSIENLMKGIAFIKKEIESGGKVYVHCHLGEGRGPTMVLAYLMSTGLLLEDAISLVKKTRPFIRPTKKQLERLAELEEIFQKKMNS